jgi:P27 family predicted phage terminase small subunit
MTARKPSDRRQNRETKDLPAGEGGNGLVEPPACPPGLHEDIDAAWRAFWSLAPLSRRVSDADRLPLIRLFQLYEVYRRSIADFMEKPYVTSDRGTLVAHPSWNIANAAMRQILPLEKQFGITPKSRAELGVSLDVPSNPAKGAGALDFTEDDE